MAVDAFVRAEYALNNGDYEKALEYLCLSNYALGGGGSVYDWTQQKDLKAKKSQHEETWAMQKQVKDYYRVHRGDYKNKDIAAEKLAGYLVPATVRQVREWLKGV
jgi:hypothetical protein